MKQIFKVVKEFVAVMAACVVVLFAFSCEKREAVELESGEEESRLFVSILSGTKSDDHLPASPDNNKVNMLEIFIFRAEGEDAGVLDAYKKLSGAELVSLSGIEMRATVGKKIIYAVVNSHDENWSGVGNLEDFQQKLASFRKEDIEDMTMIGSVEETLQITTSVTIPVSRLLAKIRLSTIGVNFAGTPYEGMALKNVKAYLTNVYGEKSYASGADGSSLAMLNYKGFSEADIAGCKNGKMLSMSEPVDITRAEQNVGYNFFCYENMIEEESDHAKFTRLVIEGELDGKRYYYPININREGFKHPAITDHSGIRRNSSYTLSVTICRPGSTNPDEILEYGALTASLNIKDWVLVPTIEVQF